MLQHPEFISSGFLFYLNLQWIRCYPIPLGEVIRFSQSEDVNDDFFFLDTTLKTYLETSFNQISGNHLPYIKLTTIHLGYQNQCKILFGLFVQTMAFCNFKNKFLNGGSKLTSEGNMKKE